MKPDNEILISEPCKKYQTAKFLEKLCDIAKQYIENYNEMPLQKLFELLEYGITKLIELELDTEKSNEIVYGNTEYVKLLELIKPSLIIKDPPISEAEHFIKKFSRICSHKETAYKTAILYLRAEYLIKPYFNRKIM